MTMLATAEYAITVLNVRNSRNRFLDSANFYFCALQKNNGEVAQTVRAQDS